MRFSMQGYITCAWGVSKIGYVLICYGLSDAVFSATFGPIMRFVGGRPPIFAFGAVVNLATIAVLFLWRPNADEVWVFFAIGFLWGMADAIWQTQINGV